MFRTRVGVRSVLGLVALLPVACALSEDPPSLRIETEGGATSTGGAQAGSGASGASQGGRGTGGRPAFVTGGFITGSGGGSGFGGALASKGGASGMSGGGTNAGAAGGNLAKGGGAGASGGTTIGGASGGASISKGGGAGAAMGGAATGGTSASKGGAGAAMGGAASGGAAMGGAASGGAASGGAVGTGGAAPGCGACLVHRYSFAGTGTQVTDSIGTAHGKAMNTALASGSVPLSGTDQYVSLPANVLSGLSSATIETWVTWNAGAAWQRIFDFGSNNGTTAGAQGPEGVTYLFLSPKAVNSSGKLRVAYSVTGPTGEVMIDSSAALPSSGTAHVAVVIDDPADRLSLYLNGAAAGSTALTSPLSAINSVNNWLGRSQFQPDPEFGGQIHEFRIYGSARSATQIQASFAAGPDLAPTN